jgi:glycosyltransferase involved in cell wall biosynthesis
MRIGIDISSVVYGTGVSRYTSNLTRALIKRFPKEEFIFYGGSLRHFGRLKQFSEETGADETSLYPLPPRLSSVVFNKLHLSIERFSQNLDVFHSWDWYTPKTIKAALVTTVHDLSAIKYPQDTNPDIVKHHKQSLAWIKKEASEVIAVSNATKKDLVEIIGIGKERVNVVYEGLPEEQRIDVAKSGVKRVKQKYSIDKPYMLIVGSQEPRKNLNRMIEAWERFNKDYLLVLVGKKGYLQVADRPGMVKTGYVDSRELAALYKGSVCLLFASIYEGFGLPILEAFYHETPVVTGNISSMPEVAGEAGVLVNPLDVDSITEGMKQALENKAQLVKLGKQRLKKFDWDEVADKTMEIYIKASGDRRV